MDLAALQAELHMEHGDPRPLANWIESNGEITPNMRRVLVEILRGERKPSSGKDKKSGSKRTWSQIELEMQILLALKNCIRFGYVTPGNGQEGRAMDHIAGLYGITPESIKQYKKKAKERKKQGTKSS